MKYLKMASAVIKCIAYLAVGLALGYILGDEINQRKLRADLRQVCAEQFVEKMGEPENKLAELIVQYQCRNAIP